MRTPVPPHQPGDLAQLRLRRLRPPHVPGEDEDRLHPRVPGPRRDQLRVRPGRLPDRCVHQRVHRGVHEPEPHDLARRLQAAVPEEQLPGRVLSAGLCPMHLRSVDYKFLDMRSPIPCAPPDWFRMSQSARHCLSSPLGLVAIHRNTLLHPCFVLSLLISSPYRLAGRFFCLYTDRSYPTHSI